MHSVKMLHKCIFASISLKCIPQKCLRNAFWKHLNEKAFLEMHFWSLKMHFSRMLMGFGNPRGQSISEKCIFSTQKCIFFECKPRVGLRRTKHFSEMHFWMPKMHFSQMQTGRKTVECAHWHSKHFEFFSWTVRFVLFTLFIFNFGWLVWLRLELIRLVFLVLDPGLVISLCLDSISVRLVSPARCPIGWRNAQFSAHRLFTSLPRCCSIRIQLGLLLSVHLSPLL